MNFVPGGFFGALIELGLPGKYRLVWVSSEAQSQP
jgi:hypothetical protein